MVWWNRYIGIPFAEKGRDIKACDCYGLIRLVYQMERGIKLPSNAELYESTTDRELLRVVMQNERQHWTEVTDPQPFDVILLRMAGVPMHVGLVTKPGFMVHCARDIDTVHERYEAMRWKNKVAGFFRYE